MNNRNTAVALVLLIIISNLCSIGFGIFYQSAQQSILVDERIIYQNTTIEVDALYGIWFKQYTDGPEVYCNATIYGVDENGTIYPGSQMSQLWGSHDGWSSTTFVNFKGFMNLTFCLSIYVNNTSWSTTDGSYYEVNKTLVVGGNMVITVWHTLGFNHYGYMIMSSLMGTEWWND